MSTTPSGWSAAISAPEPLDGLGEVGPARAAASGGSGRTVLIRRAGRRRRGAGTRCACARPEPGQLTGRPRARARASGLRWRSTPWITWPYSVASRSAKCGTSAGDGPRCRARRTPPRASRPRARPRRRASGRRRRRPRARAGRTLELGDLRVVERRRPPPARRGCSDRRRRAARGRRASPSSSGERRACPSVGRPRPWPSGSRTAGFGCARLGTRRRRRRRPSASASSASASVGSRHRSTRLAPRPASARRRSRRRRSRSRATGPRPPAASGRPPRAGSLMTFSGRKFSFCWCRIHRSRAMSAAVELPVARRRALGVDEALALEEPDLRDRDVRELVAQRREDLADREVLGSRLLVVSRQRSRPRPHAEDQHEPADLDLVAVVERLVVDPVVVHVGAVQRADVA